MANSRRAAPTRSLLSSAGALLILVQLGFRAWALWGSWFYFDDLAFMSRAMNQPFDVGYLTESYGGHLMPAGFALAWVLTDVGRLRLGALGAVLLALQLVASIGMFRLLLSMFGRKPFVLVLLTGYLAWIFTLPAGLWWAAGINQLPLQIALVFGLHAHLEYLRTAPGPPPGRRPRLGARRAPLLREDPARHRGLRDRHARLLHDRHDAGAPARALDRLPRRR